MRKELSVSEIQEISLHILKEIIALCKKLELRYCLIYGSLIGAVRHKGFIPWDDDLDLMMPRQDYEQLIAYFIENRAMLEPLELFEPRVKKEYPYMIARISDSRYILDAENEEDYGIGVFVDIYPFDGLGNTKKEALHYGLTGDRLSSLCFQASRKRFEIGTTKSLLRKIIKYPVFLFAHAIGKEWFQKKLAQTAGKKDYDTSEYIGCVVWLSGGEKDIFKREWFEGTAEVLFGGVRVCIPKQYDRILRHIYGDYRKLPPASEQKGHHNYKAYEKESVK